MRGRCKRGIAVFLLMIMLGLQVGCGTNESGAGQETVVGNESGNSQEEIVVLEEKNSDFIYVAKEAVTQASAWSLMDAELVDDNICYASSRQVVRNALSGQAVESDFLTWEDAPGFWSIEQVCFGADDSIYAYVYVRVDDEVSYYLCKFDAQGMIYYARELIESENIPGGEWNSSWKMVADSEGRLYFVTDSRIGLFAEDGSYHGEVTFDNAGAKVDDMVRTKDGRTYVAYTNGVGGNCYIAELDFAGKKTVNARKSMEVKGLSVGMEKELLAYSEESVYEYDVAAGTMVPLFAWSDCDINGQNVQSVDVTTDGRLMVISSTYGADCMVSLIEKKTQEEAAQVTQKVEITIGILSEAGKSLGEAVAYFNRENEKYRVVLKNYSAGEGTIAGEANLNSEIAAGRGPDIFELSNLDVTNLAEKGLFENLHDYLDESDKFSAEDFVDRLLELYTIDGKLVGIPHTFNMRTYMGNSELLGEEMGWTLEEMLEFIREHSDKMLLYGKSRLSMLNTFMSFNESGFIDWETGECSFDSQEFIALLELVASFPEDASIGMGKPSEFTKVSNGEVILAELFNMKDFFSLQPYSRIFKDNYTCIGYPNQGGIGCECIPEDVMAISTQSENKEGAWEFLEYFYQYTSRRATGYSSLKSVLEEKAQESMTREELFMTTHHYPDGATYTEQNPTQEEIDLIYQLMDGMQLADMDIDVFFIIKEEVAAYFLGQKTAEEVAEIIQNRVQIYVEENQ